MRHAHSKTRQKRPARKSIDESLSLPFNGAPVCESARDVAQQVLEDVRRETQSNPKPKVPDYVLDYLSEFSSIDHLPSGVLQNVINGLDESGQAYYFELVELMVGESHNLSRDEAERTALKLALKHSRNSCQHEY